MSAAGTGVEIERRLRDPLLYLRGAGDAVAFVGPDIPLEVLLASGRPHGHLPWRADRPTPWADRWLESSFPCWARSILEQWHDGAFDGIADVVFSRADDASQRLYYYVQELRRRGRLSGPAPQIFDVALIPRESSVTHTAAAVASLMQWLGVGSAELGQGVERANRLRRRLAAIERARTKDGPFFERLLRAALWSDPTDWIDGAGLPTGDCAGPRVLLAGSMPVDGRLHEAVEIAGASVIAEAHALAPYRLGPELAIGQEPPATAVARQLHAHSVSPRAFGDRARAIAARARDVRAGAVVIWMTREDEALSWSVPGIRRALAAAGIPALILAAADWRAADGALDAITDFCRGEARASA